MCNPTAMFAAQAGLAVVQGISQFQAQGAAYDLSVEQSRINNRLARDNALGQYADLAQRQTEEREAAAASIDDTARRAAEARASARVAAGEAGVAGASVDALLADYARQEFDFQVRIQRNTENLDRRLDREREGIAARERSFQLYNLPIAKPNFLQQLPGIAGAGLGAFQSSYYDPFTRRYKFG